jgi:hypothetical protein
MEIYRNMKNIVNRICLLIRKLLVVSSMVLVVSCGGSSGGGGGDDGFLTPTLPGDAARFDATNANDTAVTTMAFVDTFSLVTQLKTEEAPSIPQVINRVINQFVKRNRNSPSVAARTEDISGGLCVSGTAIAVFTETANSEVGTITFTNCDVGSGILINGSLPYDTSWDNVSLDYSFLFGGTLSFQIGSDTIVIVMNLSESGNVGTGDFSSSISFSLSGIPGGGFLVTTTQPLVGNAFTLTVDSGQLIVEGADNTRLRITVTGSNAADVDLDNGSGIFVLDSAILF